MMRDFANWALDTAKVRGATYADARVMDIRLRDLSTKNGQVGTLAESESYGIGIRVIAQGSWGFASTDRLTREGIAACAAEAVAIAKASALAKKHDVEMVPVDAYQDTWQNPYVKDPFQIPIERQLDLLLAADREMSRVKGVTVAETSMNFRRIEQFFASSLGSAIHQIKMQSGAGIVATAFAGNEIQKRSYPNSFGGQHMLAGYELVESLDLVGNALRVAVEAVALHSAAQSPEGTKTIILDSSQLGLQIHESIGHPIELDRVLGMEANFAGMSFLTTEKLGKLRYGSDIVNVVADARLEHGPGLGTFGYDDEGVPAQCTPIITDGLFTGYLSNRETGCFHRPETLRRNDAHGIVEPPADHPHDQHQHSSRNVALQGPDRRHRRRHFDGDESLLVHRRPPLPFSVFHGNCLGNQGRQENAHAEKSQLQRHHHGILEQLRRHLFARALDALGHAQLRQGPAHADDGHGPRRIARALSQHQAGRRVREVLVAQASACGVPIVSPCSK